MLKEIGRDICRSILIYYKGLENTFITENHLQDDSNKNHSIHSIRDEFRMNPLPKDIEIIRNEILSDFQTKIQSEMTNIALNKENEHNLAESDSGPSDDNLEKEELKKLLPKKTKSNKKKSRISLDSEPKKTKVKEVKPVVIVKSLDKKESNNINLVQLTKMKKKVMPSLFLDKKDKDIQDPQVEIKKQNFSISNYKEQVNSLTKHNESNSNFNSSMKMPHSLIFYLPKSLDKESQTEVIFFSA